MSSELQFIPAASLFFSFVAKQWDFWHSSSVLTVSCRLWVILLIHYPHPPYYSLTFGRFVWYPAACQLPGLDPLVYCNFKENRVCLVFFVFCHFVSRLWLHPFFKYILMLQLNQIQAAKTDPSCFCYLPLLFTFGFRTLCVVIWLNRGAHKVRIRCEMFYSRSRTGNEQ